MIERVSFMFEKVPVLLFPALLSFIDSMSVSIAYF